MVRGEGLRSVVGGVGEVPEPCRLRGMADVMLSKNERVEVGGVSGALGEDAERKAEAVKDDSGSVATATGNGSTHRVGVLDGVDPNETISYSAVRVIGNGSFGVVFQATVGETGETVAIKKVLQDKRFKNRELQIMRTLEHPNVVQLKHCFYSSGEKVRLISLMPQ